MKKIILNIYVARLLIKPLLVFHQVLHKLISRLSIILNNGKHPKMEIMNYMEWFVSKVNSDETVLDVGSHHGEMVKALSRKAKQVIGIEIVKKNFELAKKINMGPNITYLYGDATEYQFEPQQKIDCVTLSNVLEHIEHRVHFLKSLKEKIPWRNSQIKILIRVPMIDRDWLTIYKKNMGIDYRLDPTHYVEYTFEQFSEEIKSANLKLAYYHIKFGEIYAVCC
jgi:predicted RNA methylase